MPHAPTIAKLGRKRLADRRLGASNEARFFSFKRRGQRFVATPQPGDAASTSGLERRRRWQAYSDYFAEWAGYFAKPLPGDV
jgi:hypothetical protein